jgi:acetyltransferase
MSSAPSAASIGDAIDIDFGDLLDYFALDRNTRAILMYVEQISEGQEHQPGIRVFKVLLDGPCRR